MKKAFTLSFFAAAVLGAAWHFLYHLLPCPLTAVLSPVNESVWEHLKLLYFPPLAVGIVMSLRWKLAQKRFWSAMAAVLLFMPAVLLGSFYALTAGFGVAASLAFDIALYYITLILGWFLLYRLSRSGAAQACFGPLLIGSGTFGAALVVFTIAAPALPIFMAI
ncbi:MAG: hypothetical protein E7464_05760 [Ruminococcaceae bacterium]|nr:hypothetical protein [Oscillospiraceae bacterium]